MAGMTTDLQYKGYFVRDAEALARRLHAGQKDQSGHDYTGHLGRVAAGVKGARRKIVAWLHDSVEDTAITAQGLLDEGVPADCVVSIQMMSHVAGQPRKPYIEAIATDDVAADVKDSDMADNSDPARLALIEDDATRERLTAKYARDRGVLADARARLRNDTSA